MTQSRRDVLSVLGLSAAVVSTEALADKEFLADKVPDYVPAMARRSPEFQDMAAQQIENLAKSVRNRDAIATNIVVKSETEGAGFLSHQVVITVELPVRTSEVRAPDQVRKAEELHRKASKALDEAREALDDAREEARRIIAEARDEAFYIIERSNG